MVDFVFLFVTDASKIASSRKRSIYVGYLKFCGQMHVANIVSEHRFFGLVMSIVSRTLLCDTVNDTIIVR